MTGGRLAGILLLAILAGVAVGWRLGRRHAHDADVWRALPPAAASRGGTWTLATYNIRNFFDRFDNPYSQDETAKPKSGEECDALVTAIETLDADVVLLQEVEAGGFLRQFAQRRLPHYPYVAEEPTEDPRGITLGAISRLPILRIISHRLLELEPSQGRSVDNRFARDLLRLDIAVRPDYVVSVYGLHLKSKRTDLGDADRRRLAEAQAAQRVIRQEMIAELQGRFVVAGDFNDTPDSPVAKTIAATSRPPLTDALMGTMGERVTFENAQHREGIDFIWLSPALSGALTAPAEILRGGAFDKASDHRPVKVKLRVE